jgi:hypothetical protein
MSTVSFSVLKVHDAEVNPEPLIRLGTLRRLGNVDHHGKDGASWRFLR